MKWAGGKGQLLAQFAAYYPPQLGEGSIQRVVEPFVGSGAVFLNLAQRFSVREFVLNDANPEVMLVYRVIQRAPERLIDRLHALQAQYLALDDVERPRFFYSVRQNYNHQRGAVSWARSSEHCLLDVSIQRAAWTIFLNRTCFNGLFRVNAKGEFNVPFGRYRRPTICDAANLRAVSSVLQRATLLDGDYTQVEPWVDATTFVYFDPPYRPLSRTAGFTAYAAGGFNDTHQHQLATFFTRLHMHTGAKLMLSNSDPANTEPTDDFFQKLYSRFNIHRVQASRMINSKAAHRGKITELLITNY
jgi:DNA adenine methylase